MNFSELVDKVIVETKRPDMGFTTAGGDGTIPQKVLAAILTLHTLDNFYKDIKTALVIFDQAAYIQTLDTQSIPRYRQVSYLRKYDMTLNTYQQNPTLLPPLGSNIGSMSVDDRLALIKILDVDDVFDEEYKTEKVNVAYQVGDTLMIKSNTSLASAEFGWYSFPNVIPGSDGLYSQLDSFIARDHPFAIIYHAASSIFAQTGKQDQSRKYDDPNVGLVTQQIRNLLISNIRAKGV